MNVAKCTPCQARVLLSEGPCAAVDPQILGELSLTGKFGWSVSQMAADARERGSAVLIVSLAGDSLSPVLAALAGDQLAAAAAALGEYLQAEEKILAVPGELSLELPGFRTVPVDPTPVLREESALYHLLETGELRSGPLDREFPSQGYKGLPTVAIDGETLLKLYAMTQPGFQETKLVAVGAGGEVRLAEVLVGVPVKTLVEELGLQTEKPLLLGDITGAFSDGSDPVAWDSLFDSVTLYSGKDCMADTMARLFEQVQAKSCAKCVLCREGAWHLGGIFQGVTQGKGKKEDLDMVMDIGPLIRTGAFCSFGQHMARLAVTGLERNRAELEAHIVKKKCPANVCVAFNKKLYCIDPTLCTGCGDCEDECPEMAIEGKKKFIYMVDPDMCTGCGSCVAACGEEAIVINDGSMKLPKKLTKVGKFK